LIFLAVNVAALTTSFDRFLQPVPLTGDRFVPESRTELTLGAGRLART
jgi:hypothetical protein